MKIFIGYNLRGADRDKVQALRLAIAERFDVREALTAPPHFTLFPSFEMADDRLPQEALARLAAETKAFTVAVEGFGKFDEGVWFLRVATPAVLLELKESLERLMRECCSVESKRRGQPFNCHVTLAYKDVAPEVFSHIGEYLRGQELPVRRLTVDSFSVFTWREGRYEESAVFTFGPD